MDARLVQWLAGEFRVFLLVLVRVGALVFMMPVFGSRAVPMQVKALITLVLAVILTPVARFTPADFPGAPLSFAVTVAGELMVGLTLALMLRLIFGGVQLAGQMVGFQMGFSVANVVDPQTGAQSVIMAQFIYLTALLLFLVVNGHHLILYNLFESLQLLHPGHIHLHEGLYRLVSRFAAEMFILSVKLLAPVMAILLFSQVALGILAKTVPQMNLLMLSFGLNIGLGLFFLGLCMEVFWPVLARTLMEAANLLPAAVRLLAGS